MAVTPYEGQDKAFSEQVAAYNQAIRNLQKGTGQKVVRKAIIKKNLPNIYDQLRLILEKTKAADQQDIKLWGRKNRLNIIADLKFLQEQANNVEIKLDKIEEFLNHYEKIIKKNTRNISPLQRLPIQRARPREEDSFLTTLEQISANTPTLVALNFEHSYIAEAVGLFTSFFSRKKNRKKIYGNEAVALAAALEKNTVVTTLNLVQNCIGDKGAKAFAGMLEKNIALTELNLYSNNIGTEGGKALAEALAINRTLRNINFFGNNLRDETAKILAASLEKNNSLATLNVAYCNINSLGASSLLKALTQNFSLTTLDFSGMDLSGEAGKFLGLAIEKNACINTLELAFCKLGTEGIKFLAKGLEQNFSVYSLNIAGNHIGDEGTTLLATSLIKHQVLTFLDIAANHMTIDGISALCGLIEKNTHLRKIYFYALHDDPYSSIINFMINQSNIPQNSEELFEIALVSFAPDRNKLNQLPITQNNAYVRWQDKVFSVNKTRSICNEINFNHEALTQFDQIVDIASLGVDKSKLLTQKQLEQIDKIIEALNFFHSIIFFGKKELLILGMALEKNTHLSSINLMLLEVDTPARKKFISYLEKNHTLLEVTIEEVHMQLKTEIVSEVKTEEITKIEDSGELEKDHFNDKALKEKVKTIVERNEELQKNFHLAVEQGNLTTVQHLLQKGVGINSSNAQGMTALHIAAEHGHFAVVKFLIENGAISNLKNNKQQIAYDLAHKRKNFAITNYLSSPQIFSYIVPPADEPKPRYQTILSEELQITQRLGGGNFAEVYLGEWNSSPVAVKKLKTISISSEEMATFLKEAEILSGLNFPHIVRLYGLSVAKPPFIVMEFCGGGSLDKRLTAGDFIAWEQREKWAYEIALGIKYLHAHNVLHCDLACRNVLLDEKNLAKLTDFGLSKIKRYDQNNKTVLKSVQYIDGDVSVYWIGPEFLYGEKRNIFTTKTDMFSYGVLLWELASHGDLPLKLIRNVPASKLWDTLIQKVVVERYRDPVPLGTPKTLGQAMEACRNSVPEERPDAVTVVNYFKENSNLFFKPASFPEQHYHSMTRVATAVTTTTNTTTTTKLPTNNTWFKWFTKNN